MSLYIPKDGDIIFGPFANDLSNHNAVVLHVINKMVYLFPISSRENTLRYFKRMDSDAVVELNKAEIQAIFKNNAKDLSFIYCGKRNIITKTISEIQVLVEKGEAFVRSVVANNDLMERIAFGVYNSRTNEDETIKRIFGITENK